MGSAKAIKYTSLSLTLITLSIISPWGTKAPLFPLPCMDPLMKCLSSIGVFAPQKKYLLGRAPIPGRREQCVDHHINGHHINYIVIIIERSVQNSCAHTYHQTHWAVEVVNPTSDWLLVGGDDWGMRMKESTTKTILQLYQFGKVLISGHVARTKLLRLDVIRLMYFHL